MLHRIPDFVSASQGDAGQAGGNLGPFHSQSVGNRLSLSKLGNRIGCATSKMAPVVCVGLTEPSQNHCDETLVSCVGGIFMDIRPSYQRRLPRPQNPLWFNFNRVDLSQQPLPPYPQFDSSEQFLDARPLANERLDYRAAAAVSASVGDPAAVRLEPGLGSNFDPNALLENKSYGGEAPTIFILTAKCLGVMAYEDYFPDAPNVARLRPMVSQAIMAASPGWCGSFGPDVDDHGGGQYEGNYDITQMWIIPLAYAYYDLLTPAAQDRLIATLLARGRVHRASIAGADDVFTSGVTPNDWSRAGYISEIVKLKDIPETENHVLMIATARYLTNQLLYQRTRELQYDNRRNGDPKASRPNGMDHILGLLRNQLRDDFAEYNAKPYQEETRHALLNLYSYAYDAEVKLAAGMVLDYVSAHVAVSSNDLRRMVPFRRRNEKDNVQQIPDDGGFLDVSLTDGPGTDPISAHFAVLAGNTRAYRQPNPPGRPWAWAISSNFSDENVLEAIGDYRLAPSVHDLFVNDLHRRFYQRLHRHLLLEEPGQQRNCDNMEICAGSPSYLITAGGKPAIWVIPGDFGLGYQAQNLGVAVPISFMPTGTSAGPKANPNNARDLIQLMHFSDDPEDDISAGDHGGTENYGVAPDFACGYQFHLPDWTGVPRNQNGRFFVNKRSTAEELAGFYLAIHKQDAFLVLEAFDTWRHPEVSFEDFQRRVAINNPSVSFVSGQEATYTTFFGNRIHYVIWHALERDNHVFGSKILSIDYGNGDPNDTLVDAGNDTNPFLSGTIMKSPGDGVVEIRNAFLGTTLLLDWSDPQQLLRVSETGEVQGAGRNHQVWVDFNWDGPSEGDFYRPFKTIQAALNAVVEPGVIRILSGTTRERPVFHKRVRLSGVHRPVTIGAHT
jgi:hypothetical protein